MKEKETVTVVCSHCGQPHEVEVKHKFLFYEEWSAAEPRSYRIGLEQFTSNPFKLTREEWEVCRPKENLRGFVRQLHERVLALEAALAEKGGSL